MRLIDADKLKYCHIVKAVMSPMRSAMLKEIKIDEIPTAFDFESVIEQLKELKTYKLDMADTMLELMKRDKLGTYVCLEDVIEIIESAANATNRKNGG